MISLPKRGAMRVLSVEVERELEEEDLLQLRFMPDNSPPTLKKVSARHRRTAMLVAEGRSNVAVAEALGYTPARVEQLKHDPSFGELVAYYEDQIHEGRLGDERRFQEKLLAAGEGALDELNERLEGEGVKEISTGELRQIVTMAADRTIAPPKSIVSTPMVPQRITLNFGREIRTEENEVEKEVVGGVEIKGEWEEISAEEEEGRRKGG